MGGHGSVASLFGPLGSLSAFSPVGMTLIVLPLGPPTCAEAALGGSLGVSDELLPAASPGTRTSSGPGDGPVPTSGTLHAGPAALWPEKG